MTSSSFFPSPEAFRRLGAIVLVGHRGSGKSTLGAGAASALGLDFFDLDDELLREFGSDFSSILANAPSRFRQREEEILSRLVKENPGAVIATGAGADPIPPEAFVIWLDREDWAQEVLRSDRPRVRPELSAEEEWRWMEETRRPRWLRRSHLRLPISRGRTIEKSTEDLITLLAMAALTPESPLAKKTWLVPSGPEELQRANLDARRFGFGGIEIRSDLFPEPPSRRDMPFIASLRHDDPRWLKTAPHPRIWDIDLEFFPALMKSLPETLPLQIMPAEMILSLHPDRISPSHIESLARAAQTLHSRGFSLSSLILKYAPQVQGFEELQRCLGFLDLLRAIPASFTLLPQGPAMAWTRPLLAAENATNYLPIGLREARPDHPSAMDFGAFLPHLAGPMPTVFEALLGDPVAASQGDLHHRRAALQEDRGERSYLKITVPAKTLTSALALLEPLPIRGLSITSPLKREAAADPFVDNPRNLEAVNTLSRSSDRKKPWIADDTDEAGMLASLQELREMGISPATAVVFGRGGASFAVLRALEKEGWKLVAHLSARKGWSSLSQDIRSVELIINAAGPELAYREPEHIPSAAAWIDLHYQNVAPPPIEARHLQGDLFFAAQAEEQRWIWNKSES